MGEVIEGEGYAVATDLDALGEGYGFRKVRKELGVEAFGVNVITIPPGYETGVHWHDQQQELYFVHRGTIVMTFDDGDERLLEEGGAARVDASTRRRVRNVSDSEPAVYMVVGGKNGYVGRDGRQPEGETRR